MAFDAGTIIGTLDLDRDPFNVGLDQAKADGESFEARTWRTALDADVSALDAKFDDEKGKLDEFGERRVVATLDIDTGDSDEKLAVENAALDAFGKRRDVTRPEVDSSGADRGLDDIKDHAADAAGSDGLGLLMTTALSLGPALIPVGAELVAGLAAIAPMALAAGAGLGAFALAGAGDLGKVETAASAALKQFQALNAPTVLPVIGQSIGLIIPAFSALVPLVTSTATELSHLEDAASSAFASPFWSGFISFLAVQAPPAINAFTSLLGGLFKSFAGISEAFAPVIADVEGGMDGFSARIAAWGQGLSSSNGFTSFLHYVETEGPVVGNLLTTLSGTLVHLLVGLAPLGAVALAALGGLTKFLDVLTGISPILTTAAVTIAGLAFAYAKLHGPVEDAAGAVSDFFRAIANNTAASSGLVGLIGGIVDALGGIGVAAPVAGVALAAVAAVGIGVWQGFHGEVSQTVDAVESLPTRTLPQLNAAMALTQSRIASTRAEMDNANRSFENAPGAVNAFAAAASNTSSIVDALTGYLAKLRGEEQQQNDNLGFLQTQFGLSRQAALSLADSIGLNLDKALDPEQIAQFNAALQKQAAQADLTSGAFGRMSTATGAAFAAMISAGNSAASATKSSWSSLGDAVTNFSSATLPPTAAAIAQFYSESELQGASFSQNIQKAIAAGYSPTLISSIIQAGPAQASQLLQGLVNAQGTGLQTLISQATVAMTKEGAEAVEEARLTEVAVTAHSSTIAAALPTALAISQALTATNAAAQLNVVASTLSGGLPEVLAVAKEFGIAIPKGLLSETAYAATAGSAQVQAVASAISANAGAVGSAAVSTAHIFPSAVSAAAPQAATAAGEQVRQFISGYNSGAGAINSTLAAIMNGALVTANGVNWSGVGVDADAGIALGLNSGVSVVTTAAGQVMKQGLQAARDAVQATSPSKLFASQVGLPMAQGVAVGFLSGAGLITGALQSVLANAANTAQSAASTVIAGLGAFLNGSGGLGGVGFPVTVPGRTNNGGSPFQWGAPGVPPGISGIIEAPPAPSPYPSPDQQRGYPAGLITPGPDALQQLINDLINEGGVNNSGAAAKNPITFNATHNLSISVPPGSSQELISTIQSTVKTSLDDFSHEMINEMAAI